MYAVPSCHILQKSIKLVLNVRKTWYHERPSSQITPIIIVQQIMRFKTVASFYRFLGKLVQESRLSSAYLWYCFWPWWIVWDICRNKVRFNNLIQMHLSTYSEVLFNVEYQGLGFLGISICPVGMISKRATWVVMSIFVCPHQSFYFFYISVSKLTRRLLYHFGVPPPASPPLWFGNPTLILDVPVLNI